MSASFLLDLFLDDTSSPRPWLFNLPLCQLRLTCCPRLGAGIWIPHVDGSLLRQSRPCGELHRPNLDCCQDQSAAALALTRTRIAMHGQTPPPTHTPLLLPNASSPPAVTISSLSSSAPLLEPVVLSGSSLATDCSGDDAPVLSPVLCSVYCTVRSDKSFFLFEGL